MDNEMSFVQHFMFKSLVPEAKNSKGKVYDCVFRAHRDVLTGRFYLPNYCNEKDENGNRLVESLCKMIQSTNLYKKVGNKQVPMTSMDLIDFLCEQYPNVEFGAIQKLVNMTLKYMYILSVLGDTVVYGDIAAACAGADDLEINPEEHPVYGSALDCYDCPLDSRILEKLGTKHTPWTKMGREEYLAVQTEIHDCLIKDGLDVPNMVFDFLNW